MGAVMSKAINVHTGDRQMTKADLIEALKEVPDDALITLDVPTDWDDDGAASIDTDHDWFSVQQISYHEHGTYGKHLIIHAWSHLMF
jgi:hypothetical protein